MNPRVFSEEDFDQVAQAAWDSVVPIMALHGKNLRQHGTGTLFGVADHSFLVTAAHVALEARDTGAELCTMTRKDGGQVLTIGGKWVVSAKRQRGQKDPFDVAVLKLAKECTVHLTARLLLRLDDVSLQPTSFDDEVYLAFGFPTECSKPAEIDGDSTIEVKPVRFATKPFSSRETLPNFDPSYHLAFNGRREKMAPATSTIASFPNDLSGISGCSIFRVGWDARWITEKARIVGVQTHVYNRSRAIARSKQLNGRRWRSSFTSNSPSYVPAWPCIAEPGSTGPPLSVYQTGSSSSLDQNFAPAPTARKGRHPGIFGGPVDGGSAIRRRTTPLASIRRRRSPFNTWLRRMPARLFCLTRVVNILLQMADG